jgi:hypothetical protein
MSAVNRDANTRALVCFAALHLREVGYQNEECRRVGENDREDLKPSMSVGVSASPSHPRMDLVSLRQFGVGVRLSRR